MASFESSSFKKNVPNQKQFKEYNVGIPEEDTDLSQFDQAPQQQLSPEEIEDAIRAARKIKANPTATIGDTAKKRIEILADIGRLTKDVSIGGHIFSLRTLKGKEMREANLAATTTANTNLEISYELRRQRLARSIYKIDGHDIIYVLGSDDLNTKFNFIEDLEDAVAGKLFDAFSSLNKDAVNQYGINSEKDELEVSEDLKK